jgi:hypothetical protein
MKNIFTPGHGRHSIHFMIIMMTLFSVTGSYGQGDLLLTPKRILFEGTKTSELINLANSGKDTAQYVISLIHLRMNPDGTFEEISQAEAGLYSAESYLRYFPRTVTLAPNEAQVIRMQLSKQTQMMPGEYRSHLYVRALAKATPLGETTEQTSSIAVKLVPVFGISIPIIIRVGESNTLSTITGLKLITSLTETPSLSMELYRTGNMSIYGDIVVKHFAPGGKSTMVAEVKGLAVYTPNPVRYIQLPLDPKIDYRSGKLVVSFLTNAGTKDRKVSEAELVLR